MIDCAVLFIMFSFASALARDPRSAEELTHCVRIAEPLIHEPNYVFPLTAPEIKRVCEKWDQFVDCIRNYTRTFLSRAQETEFEKAINPSMQSIHQLCTKDPQYEKAYLYYAPCMKKISIESSYCGDHYNFLAKIAESTTETGPAICCGYHKFRSCVLREASLECDKDDDPTRPPSAPGTDSSHFVSSMLNRALGFLLQKCAVYEPSTQDCLSYMTRDSKKKTNILSSFGISEAASNDMDSRGRDGRLSDFNPGDGFHGNNNINDRRNGDRPSNPDWNRPNPSSVNNGNSFPSKYKPPVTVYPESHTVTNRFTWTTVTPSFFPTRNSTFDFGNSIREPESQEFRGQRGSAVSLHSIPSSIAVMSSSLFLCILRAQWR